MRQIILILSLFISYTLTAQSANDIKNNPNVYIWGEGEGSSLRLADEKALVDLSSQIVSHVTGKKRTDIINIQEGNDAKSKVSFEEVMETYTSCKRCSRHVASTSRTKYVS